MTTHDPYPNETVLEVLGRIEQINRLKDVDSIIDRVLYESRQVTHADAGSIFLVKGDMLEFSYVHNDTLFKEDEANQAVYDNSTVSINERSIVGYSALTGGEVVIDDAYALSEALPYRFNPAFDRSSGYRTRSILTIPLKTFDDRLVGVMQLINAKDPEGRPVRFSEIHRRYVPLLASHASAAIQRGTMNRELILRMVQMAQLRDPSETGAHVQRVGGYSAEIYQQWARNRKLNRKDINRRTDIIRLAAMLHDVGKVAIADRILKKPARLTEEEFNEMKWHTVFGAQLFVKEVSELDRVSLEIALNHHEKFAGNGYPGKVSGLLSGQAAMGEPKKGEEIPLAARIVALADVFDALVSQRCYKDPWPEAKVFALIEEESGRHFDPEVVEAFFQILQVIQAIRRKYSG